MLNSFIPKLVVAGSTSNNEVQRKELTSLSQAEINALLEALDDEYRAWSTYDQVLRDFGDVRPFINIREAEARHIEALKRLFLAHGLSLPENNWLGKVNRYESLSEACEAGVAAEIENGEMYDRLLKSTQRQDILNVFRNLQQASQQRHLPAFKRCVARES